MKRKNIDFMLQMNLGNGTNIKLAESKHVWLDLRCVGSGTSSAANNSYASDMWC